MTPHASDWRRTFKLDPPAMERHRPYLIRSLCVVDRILEGRDSQTYIIVNVIVREILKHTKVPSSVSVNLQNVCKTHA